MYAAEPHPRRHPKLRQALDVLSRAYRRSPLHQYRERRRVAKAAREYELSTREAHMEILDDYFSPSIAMTMRDTPWFRTQSLNDTWDQSDVSFPDRLLSHILRYLHFNHRIEANDTPKSVGHWLKIVKLVVNQRAAESCAAQLEAFDAMAGVSCAETFIRDKTVGDWLKGLVHGLFLNGSRIGKDPRSAPQNPAVSVKEKAIRQVHLRGMTILEAWASEPQMRALSGWQDFTTMGEVRAAGDPNLPDDWTPETPGKQCVFHATTRQYAYRHDSLPDSFTHLDFNAVSASATGGETAYVLTAFSPLRAFLEAAFEEQMCPPLDASQRLASRRRTWESNGQTYAGLVLFRFRSVQPVPHGDFVSLFVERGERGERLVRLGDSGVEAVGIQDFHNHSRRLSGSTPEVMYVRERAREREHAHARRGDDGWMNQWRAAWTEGKGVEFLNAQHLETYAITLSLWARPARRGREYDSTDDDDDDEGVASAAGRGQ